MKITGIEQTKKGRFSLFVDGEFAFSVHKDTFLASELAKDVELTSEYLEELRRDDAYISAKEAALTLLEMREYPSAMLLRKLREHYEQEPAEAAVQRMIELGLVNDLDYGTRLAADYVNLRHYPLRRIALELGKRGFSREMIGEILEAYPPQSQVEAAAEMIRKKYSMSLFDRKGIDKTIAALLRRGFTMEDIRGALAVMVEEVRQEPPESEDYND